MATLCVTQKRELVNDKRGFFPNFKRPFKYQRERLIFLKSSTCLQKDLFGYHFQDKSNLVWWSNYQLFGLSLVFYLRCLDVTSAHASSTGDYDPNGTTSEWNNPKTFRPCDTTSAVLYRPRFHVHPCFDLDTLSHVTLHPTWTTRIMTFRPSFY
jgi:hypothetical protein